VTRFFNVKMLAADEEDNGLYLEDLRAFVETLADIDGSADVELADDELTVTWND
jgi:hypothetical protein